MQTQYELRDEAHVFRTEQSSRIENIAAIAKERWDAGAKKQTVWKVRADEQPRLVQVILGAAVR